MAEEITESSPTTRPEPPPICSAPDRRPTRPGRKRLLLTLSVLLSFLLALPLLYKSTAIHRSPLPSAPLSSALSSPPPFLHALFLRSRPSDAPRLHLAISHHLRSKTDQFSLSVTVDSPADCSSAPDPDPGLYPCGGLRISDLVAGDDEDVDEVLDSALRRRNGERAYTVVVAEGEGEVRAVVGKHRHAWVVGRAAEEEVVRIIGEIFVEWFMNGGMGGGRDAGKGEFMPVGSDGSVVLSFSLLNADPSDWVFDWEFQNISETMLVPLVEALSPIAKISIESQVLYYTPKSSVSYWDESLKSHVFTVKDLPFFVNSNEWHLDTSISAAGRSKVLQFVLPNGETSETNSFISPMWGGVVIWNPSICSMDSHGSSLTSNMISAQDLQNIFQVFVGQLRVLFGLRSSNRHGVDVCISNFVASERGFTEWELEILYQRHAQFNLLSSLDTLDSLSKLVHSLPRMIVLDEIGKQVKLSLDAVTLAQRNASRGLYDASAVSSRNARALAEDAFFHPSIMSISYASIEHYFAIYMPFFAPVSLHVILAVIYELKRYKRERAKYQEFIADKAKSS